MSARFKMRADDADGGDPRPMIDRARPHYCLHSHDHSLTPTQISCDNTPWVEFIFKTVQIPTGYNRIMCRWAVTPRVTSPRPISLLPLSAAADTRLGRYPGYCHPPNPNPNLALIGARQSDSGDPNPLTHSLTHSLPLRSGRISCAIVA